MLIVEPCEEFVRAYGLLVAHSITDAVANHTMVQVMNPCFAPVTVHENVSVGMLHSIFDCAKIQPARKQSRPKQAIKDAIGQMTSSLAPDVQDRVAVMLWKYQYVIALNGNDQGCWAIASTRQMHFLSASPLDDYHFIDRRSAWVN